MQYIFDEITGVIDFDKYTNYLSAIRYALPNHVYEFASNPSHFDLSSPTSLHDAWLISATLKDQRDTDQSPKSISVELIFLGPKHDRHIHLKYSGVTHFGTTGSVLGDLCTHEIRLGKSNGLTHEFLFAQNARLTIECADMSHSESQRSAA